MLTLTVPAHLRSFVLSHPAATGGTVCQGHADVCAIIGHGTHTVDGIVSPYCSRCGDPR